MGDLWPNLQNILAMRFALGQAQERLIGILLFYALRELITEILILQRKVGD
jgi:hypothetical protein